MFQNVSIKLKSKLQDLLVNLIDDKETRMLFHANQSKLFCNKAGKELHEIINEYGKFSMFQTDTFTNNSEWLYDCSIGEPIGLVKNTKYGKDKTIPKGLKKIICAMECESKTSLEGYFEDFSKVLTAQSPIRVFLGGVNQKKQKWADDYIDIRLKESARIIKESGEEENTEWIIGFWPSPEKTSDCDHTDGLWDKIADGKYPHLRKIRMYRLDNGVFYEVEDGEDNNNS